MSDHELPGGAAPRRVGFSEIFGGTWRAFTSNYSGLLGYAFVLLIIGLCLWLVTAAVGAWLQVEVFESGSYAPVMFCGALVLIFAFVVQVPVLAYMQYGVLRRLRGTTQERRQGQYGSVLLIAFVEVLLFAPGQFVYEASNPGMFENVFVTIDVISEAMEEEANQGVGEQDGSGMQENAGVSNPEPEEQGSPWGKKFDTKLQQRLIPNDPMLELVAAVLWIIAIFISFIWLPWAHLAVLDPRSNVGSVSEALRYGWQLCSASRGAVIGSGIVLIVIAALTYSCCLPGIFFGAPLLFAWVPTAYMLMRGESADASVSIQD